MSVEVVIDMPSWMRDKFNEASVSIAYTAEELAKILLANFFANEVVHT